jgi:hypothetical protein
MERRSVMKQMKNQIVMLMVFLGIGSIQASAEPFAKGPYLGQTPPGSTAQVFAPGLICDTRPRQWEAWPSFSADGNTFCFNRLRYVYVTENTKHGWTTPKRIESIPYHSVSCCLSPDANSIYVKCVPFSKMDFRKTHLSKKTYPLPKIIHPLHRCRISERLICLKKHTLFLKLYTLFIAACARPRDGLYRRN